MKTSVAPVACPCLHTAASPKPLAVPALRCAGGLVLFAARLRGAAGALFAALALAVCGTGAAQTPPWNDLGRDATPAEVKAWDIDVRPDFKGLPKGAGSVSQGEKIWDTKCASCHGSFGESNQVFTPLVGGTTAADIARGRVKNLEPGSSYPQKTTLMKVATLSTLWDYINRAMPWNAPKTLSSDEVYAVLAYMLSLADVVPANHTLSDQNIAAAQQRMPNRNGMVLYEPLWRVDGRGDVQNTACMKDCPVDARVHSSLPAFARDAHGNIQQQNRLVGPVRGTDTTQPAPSGLVDALPRPVAALIAPAATAGASDVKALLVANSCTACHGMANKIVGPGFSEIAGKHPGKADLVPYLAGKIRAGGAGVYGAVPMPPQPQLSPDDARAIAQWLAAGAR